MDFEDVLGVVPSLRGMKGRSIGSYFETSAWVTMSADLRCGDFGGAKGRSIGSYRIW